MLLSGIHDPHSPGVADFRPSRGNDRPRLTRFRMAFPAILALIASQLHASYVCGNTPATTQPDKTLSLSAISAQAPATPATESANPVVTRPIPNSLATFTHNLLTRNNLTGNWWGALGKLQTDGITPSVTLLQAASENFSGGIRTNRIDWRYRLDATLTLNTQKVFGWKGGSAFVDFMAHGGQNPANDLVGALQAISAIDQNPDTRLDQIWYRQEFLDDKLWFKIGRIDATYDLDHIRDAQPFLNGSFGFSPSIFVFPSYPFSAWGGEFSWQPIHLLTFRGGLFDGNTSNTLPAIPSNNPYAVENPYGLFALSEESLNWNLGEPRLHGTLTFGQWYHSGSFQTYSGGTRRNACGFYGYIDQTLWKVRHSDGQDASRIGAFLQYGWANDRLTEIDQNLSGGLRWRGLIPTRPDDNTGIGSTWIHISPYAHTPKSYELSIEGFYSAQLTPWLNIQPDLQYVVNPGGTYHNALVATVQMAIGF